MPSSKCCFLTCIQVSQEAGHAQVSIPISFTISHSFGVVNKAEADTFLELSYFFDDPADIGNLISGASAFSKSSLNMWTLMAHILLKSGLKTFEHYFASV